MNVWGQEEEKALSCAHSLGRDRIKRRRIRRGQRHAWGEEEEEGGGERNVYALERERVREINREIGRKSEIEREREIAGERK